MRARAKELAASRPRLLVQAALVTLFAALTAVGARVQIPLLPVPVTGQLFCVLLAGAVLGSRLGFLSQLEYLAAGAAGLPVFAHGGGLPALIGATSGYLAAFPLAALLTGLLIERLGRQWRPAFFACLCGVAVIHLFGACWYAVWVSAFGQTAGLALVLAHAVFPFLALDIVKAAAAASVAAACSPLRNALQ
jgi:biotin transport system substrate-specific component